MATLRELCRHCSTVLEQAFSGTRQTEEIIGRELRVREPCFVRDVIHFSNGQLIIEPDDGGGYENDYFVVCRRLKIDGGPWNPLGQSGNLVTWADGLENPAAPPPPKQRPAPADGYNPEIWDANLASDANGMPGPAGTDGAGADAAAENQQPSAEDVAPGAVGKNAPNVTLLALEVEAGFGDRLSLLWSGQDGGEGQRGQRGGDGGNGMGGADGFGLLWICISPQGRGGTGGPGGQGGPGGRGGDGGNGGDITIMGTDEQMLAVLDMDVHGGSGGAGGRGGFGGNGGLGGKKGAEGWGCVVIANDAAAGAPGQPQPSGIFPDPQEAPQAEDGADAAQGSAPNFTPIDFADLAADESCVNLIPLPVVASAIEPARFCRGSGAVNGLEATIPGENLDQVIAVDAIRLDENQNWIDFAGVTINIRQSSTDVQLDLWINIAANSELDEGRLRLQRQLPGDTPELPIEVQQMQVIQVAVKDSNDVPTEAVRGTTVQLDIAGICFDPNGTVQQVEVSGLGTTVLNPELIDDARIRCSLEISPIALPAGPDGRRNVTVRSGSPGGLPPMQSPPAEFTLDNALEIQPADLQVDSLQPAVYCRDSSAVAITGIVAGQHLRQVGLNQVDALETNLNGVTATVEYATDTQLTMLVTIASDSAFGTGDLIVRPDIGDPKTLSNAIEVREFRITSVTLSTGDPATSHPGDTVRIFINGDCFDPTALIQQVAISPNSQLQAQRVSVLNIQVIDENTIECDLEIGPAATLGPRNVTVVNGTLTHTLIGGFTVT